MAINTDIHASFKHYKGKEAMELKEIVNTLPECPGVYIMKDCLGNVIYVGKSINIRKRISQYFQTSRNHAPKIKHLVNSISDISFIKTDTELDALLYECRLIKLYKPRYNSQLKDYLGYSYIRLSLDEPYPRMTIVNRPTDDKAAYYGPFTSLGCVENAISFMCSHFRIRNCASAAIGKSISGCLNYQLGQCLGPCRPGADAREYADQVDKLMRFLMGKDRTPVRQLEQEMLSAAEALDFDRAARLRDQLSGVRHILGKQKLANSSKRMRNIMALEAMHSGTYKLFLFKGNMLLHDELIYAESTDKTALKDHLCQLAVQHFKAARAPKCSEFMSQEDVDEAQIIFSYLKNKKGRLTGCIIPASHLAAGSPGIDGHISKLIINAGLFSKETDAHVP